MVKIFSNGCFSNHQVVYIPEGVGFPPEEKKDFDDFYFEGNEVRVTYRLLNPHGRWNVEVIMEFGKNLTLNFTR